VGSGFADRPVVLAVPRPRKPMDGLRFKTAWQAETEAAPSRSVAELLDIDTIPSGNLEADSANV
jgi:hypothetical protein